MVVGENRIFKRIDTGLNTGGRFVLYWMQIHRRLEYNFALQRAVELARSANRPLLIYEGLRPDYPHSSDRFHGFLIDGMSDHCGVFARSGGLLGPDLHRERMVQMFPPGMSGQAAAGANSSATAIARDCYYLPFLPLSPDDARGFLVSLCMNAAAVVSDEFPTFIIPGQNQALETKLTVPFETVDANGIIPLKETKSDPYSAYLFRKILQKRFASCFKEFPLECPISAGDESGRTSGGKTKGSPVVPGAATSASTASSLSSDALLLRWDDLGMEAFSGAVSKSLDLLADWHRSDTDAKRRQLLGQFPLDRTVELLPMRGHSAAARLQLTNFLQRLAEYPEKRNDPDARAASGLSPYLHFGRISIHEIVRSIFRAYDLGDFPGGMVYNNGSKGFFPGPPEVDAFLDEAITWRETGYHFCHHRADYDQFASLPDWARTTLLEHRSDKRPYIYSLEQLENATTHDEIWNAAQRELVQTGRIHNYLRMLWGKKILEWSADPRSALETALHLNNKYSIDGRNPNSYSGVFWIFGRFDRPWQERAIFGKIRYMSSEQTRKKVKLREYLDEFGPTEQGRLL